MSPESGMIGETARRDGATSGGSTAPSLPARDPTPFVAPPLPPDLTAPASIARLDGVDLWYWDTGGTGPAVVLQHATTGSGHVWGYQQQVFEGAGYRVIGYSRRGYRGSSGGDPARPATAVDDMRMLLDHLGIERCHVIGTAGGGIVAAGFALAHPGRTLSATVSCSGLTLEAPEMLALMPLFKELTAGMFPHDVVELGPSYRALCKEGHQLWKQLARQAREVQGGLASQPYGGPRTLAEVRGISVPTLLVYGGSDLGSSPPLARLFHETIRNSELVVLTECGHSAYWERPDLFNAFVLEFMARRAG